MFLVRLIKFWFHHFSNYYHICKIKTLVAANLKQIDICKIKTLHLKKFQSNLLRKFGCIAFLTPSESLLHRNCQLHRLFFPSDIRNPTAIKDFKNPRFTWLLPSLLYHFQTIYSSYQIKDMKNPLLIFVIFTWLLCYIIHLTYPFFVLTKGVRGVKKIDEENGGQLHLSESSEDSRESMRFLETDVCVRMKLRELILCY